MLLIYACLAGSFLLAESIFPRVRRPIPRRGFGTDLLYVPVHVALRVLINGSLAVAMTRIGEELLPPSMVGVLAGQPLWAQALILLVTIDAVFYVLHRAKHRFDWWWRLHETHHSSVEIDWLSGARFHPLERALDRVIYLLPLMVLGASDGALMIWATADAFFGMFVHSNLPIRLGPLIYIVNGPEMHLWHHTPAPDGHRCNFSNNFSAFDWIFGTAHHPADFPERAGLDDPAYPHDNILRQFGYAFRSEVVADHGELRGVVSPEEETRSPVPP